MAAVFARSQLPVRRRRAGGGARRQRGTVAVRASAVEAVVRGVATAPIMYAVMSVNEYVTHRYYQHAGFNGSERLKALYTVVTGKAAPKVKGGGHVEHHAETLDDMSLKVDAAWRQSTPAKVLAAHNKWRGTAFDWKTTALMGVQMTPSALPVLMLMGYSLPSAVVITLLSLVAHGLLWNSLHPAMHGLPAVELSEGLPSGWLESLQGSAYYKYLYQNHEGHHVAGGQVNYNVCCPGVDHLVGTYMPESEWRSRANVPTYADGPREPYAKGEYYLNVQREEAKELAKAKAKLENSADLEQAEQVPAVVAAA